jgi:hypothetical protein
MKLEPEAALIKAILHTAVDAPDMYKILCAELQAHAGRHLENVLDAAPDRLIYHQAFAKHAAEMAGMFTNIHTYNTKLQALLEKRK